MPVSAGTVRTLYDIWSIAVPAVGGQTGQFAGGDLGGWRGPYYLSDHATAYVNEIGGNQHGVTAIEFDPATGEPLAVHQAYQTQSATSNVEVAYHHPDDSCITVFGVTFYASNSVRAWGQRIDYDDDGNLTPGPVAEVDVPGASVSETTDQMAFGNGGPNLGRVMGWRSGPLSNPRVVTFDLNLAAGTGTTPVFHTHAAVFGGSYNRAGSGDPTPLIGDHPQAAYIATSGVSTTSGDTFVVSYGGGTPTATFYSAQHGGARGPTWRVGDTTIANISLLGLLKATPSSISAWSGISDSTYWPSTTLTNPSNITGVHGDYWDMVVRTVPDPDAFIIVQYDPLTDAELDLAWTLDGGTGPFGASRLSADGHFWVTGSVGGTAVIWSDPLFSTGTAHWRIGRIGWPT